MYVEPIAIELFKGEAGFRSHEYGKADTVLAEGWSGGLSVRGHDVVVALGRSCNGLEAR